MQKGIVEYIESLYIFDGLRGNELAFTANLMEIEYFQKDEIIFKEGDKGDSVCFVIEGILEVIKNNTAGKNVVIAEFSKGHSIGEMALIDSYPRSATVKARTGGYLVKLTKHKFETILQERPGTGIKILKGIARLLSLNLRRTSGHLAEVLSSS